MSMLKLRSLQQLLDDGPKDETEVKRFGLADRGWPPGIVQNAHAAIGSYFGMQEAEVVRICLPHRREELLSDLWDRLGSEFRRPFTQWLRSLAEHPSPRVRSGAAVTAGVLFAKEPITAERELLRPWALDGRRALRECAGLAIGIPIVLGVDPAPSRASRVRLESAAKWSEACACINSRICWSARYLGSRLQCAGSTMADRRRRKRADQR